MNATLPRPDTSTYIPPIGTEQATTEPLLARPRNGRRIGGVCAGLADKYGWSVTTVRLLAVLSILLPGPQVLAYLIAWIVIPDEADGQAIIAIDTDKAVGDVRSVVNR